MHGMNMTMGRTRFRMAPAIYRACANMLRGVDNWIMRRRDIEHLQSLPDHMLKDIGLHRSQIMSAVYHGEPHRGRRS